MGAVDQTHISTLSHLDSPWVFLLCWYEAIMHIFALLLITPKIFVLVTLFIVVAKIPDKSHLRRKAVCWLVIWASWQISCAGRSHRKLVTFYPQRTLLLTLAFPVYFIWALRSWNGDAHIQTRSDHFKWTFLEMLPLPMSRGMSPKWF